MDRPGRRRWTAEQKQQIVEETRAPGASVSVVARRYDINANLLFKWKRHDETGRLVVATIWRSSCSTAALVRRARAM
jgi:transposase